MIDHANTEDVTRTAEKAMAYFNEARDRLDDVIRYLGKIAYEPEQYFNKETLRYIDKRFEATHDSLECADGLWIDLQDLLEEED